MNKVHNGNGLEMAYIDAGRGDDVILLLHGFPELAYSWRRVIPILAQAGYRVIAPDQRGYGETTGWPSGYDVDLEPYSFKNLVDDALGLLGALDIPSVAAVVGHDFGSPVAAWAAMIRPDVFQRLVLMSAPFGVPRINVFDAVAMLHPPRVHYHQYYATPTADPDMRNAPQGLHSFLRGYFHYKSADHAANETRPLKNHELGLLPTYYAMESGKTMPETVATEMPAEPSAWLADAELAIYSREFERTGFQGGLNWYRARIAGVDSDRRRPIEVPSTFIAGKHDWGVYQAPGTFESMQTTMCSDMRGVHFVDGAGHWVQQEQPETTSTLLLSFLQ
ncbi:MAG: alpha/beta hydrolase [Pseudomonadales bacterium]